MSVVARQVEGEADYERVRRMLVAYVGSGDEYHYCTIGDLDWWRFTSNDANSLAKARVWLDGDEAIGLAWPNGDQADLVAHPDHREIEDAMLEWSEVRHRESYAGDDDTSPFSTYAFDGDAERIARLRRRGYERTDACYRYRRCPLDAPLPAPTLPPGYTLRNIAGEEDLEARVSVHRAAFAPSKMTTAKHRAVMASPTYRRELDLVAVTPDGRFASYCIVWYDEDNRTGVFEPVGTDPAYQRKGLSRAVLTEGLRRLQGLGARIAYVNTNGDNVAANPLYDSVGFLVVGDNHAWKKAF